MTPNSILSHAGGTGDSLPKNLRQDCNILEVVQRRVVKKNEKVESVNSRGKKEHACWSGEAKAGLNLVSHVWVCVCVCVVWQVSMEVVGELS